MSQGFNQLNLFNRNLPMVIPSGSALNKIPGVQYAEIPEIMTKQPFDIGEGKQVGYKLPNGTYTSNPDLVRAAEQSIAKSRALAATNTMKKVGKAGGATALLSAPIAYMSHKDARKYYDDILNDPNASPEHKQLARAMKLKEGIQMFTEGLGAPVGTGLGTALTKNKYGGMVGGAIPYALSAGFGNRFNAALQPAMDKYGFTPYQAKPVPQGSNSGGNNGNTNPGNNSGVGGRKTGGSMPAQYTGGAAGVQGMPIGETLGAAYGLSSPQPTEASGGEAPQSNLQAINDYISQLQQVNQPYTEALQNYVNNYDDLFRKNYNAQRYWTAMAGLSGNPGYRNLAEAYNPLNQEANRINAIKQLQQAQAGNLEAINEAMGNMAIAQELGLSPEAAFANKNLLTALSMKDREENRYRIALENNLMKKYGIDRNNARALAVQSMRNAGAMDRAMLNAQAYGYGGGAQAPGLTPQGQAKPAMAINQTQQPDGMSGLFKQVTGK